MQSRARSRSRCQRRFFHDRSLNCESRISCSCVVVPWGVCPFHCTYHLELLDPSAQKIVDPSQETPNAHPVAVLWQHAPKSVVSVFVMYILPDWHSTEPTVVFLVVRRPLNGSRMGVCYTYLCCRSDNIQGCPSLPDCRR